MSAADHDDRIVRRDRVQIAAIRQPVLLQLRFVPVAVGDDDLARTAGFHARADRREHVGDAARAREIDAGAAAGVVQMAVGEPGNHRLPVQIDRRRLRAGELADCVVAADGGEAPARDRDRLRDREARVDGDDVSVEEDAVGGRRLRTQGRGSQDRGDDDM